MCRSGCRYTTKTGTKKQQQQNYIFDRNKMKFYVLFRLRLKQKKKNHFVFWFEWKVKIFQHWFHLQCREVRDCRRFASTKLPFVLLVPSLLQQACCLLPYFLRLPRWSVLSTPRYRCANLAAMPMLRPYLFIQWRPVQVMLSLCASAAREQRETFHKRRKEQHQGGRCYL